MAVIEVEERVAAALRAQASLRDLSLEDFLQRIALTDTPINPMVALSMAEMDRSIDEVASESPVLPDTFSRDEIYADHD